MARYLWILLGALLAAAPAYVVGDLYGSMEARAMAAAQSHLKAARSELEVAKRDLSTLSHAAARAAQDAAENAAAATLAQDRVTQYEQELAKRGEADRCRLDDADLRWLRDFRSGASPAAKKLARR